jgi:predicted aminopeptidase
MKSKPIVAGVLAAASVLGWLTAASQSSAQNDNPNQALNTLFAEVAAQQIVIAENHTKIDDKLAAVAEEIRLARIYSGRGGGGGKSR